LAKFSEIIDISHKTGTINQLIEQFVNRTFQTFNKLKSIHNKIRFITMPTPINYINNPTFFPKLIKFMENFDISKSSLILSLIDTRPTTSTDNDEIHKALQLLKKNNIRVALELHGNLNIPIDLLTHSNISYIYIDACNLSEKKEGKSLERIQKIVKSLSIQLDIQIIATGIAQDADMSKFSDIENILFQGNFVVNPNINIPAFNYSQTNVNNRSVSNF